MLFGVVLAAGLATIPPAGGRFALLAQLSVRRRWLLVAALVLQIIDISVLRRPPHALAAGLHLLSYALAGAFLWANRRIRGLPTAAMGGLLNVVAIAANDGTMPASPAALRLAGIAADHEHFANSAAVAGARLGVLGDVFAVPHRLGIANVFSVGDVVVCCGAILVLHAAAGSPWATRRRLTEPQPPRARRG